jgi:hypothetical protein
VESTVESPEGAQLDGEDEVEASRIHKRAREESTSIPLLFAAEVPPPRSQESVVRARPSTKEEQRLADDEVEIHAFYRINDDYNSMGIFGAHVRENKNGCMVRS